MWNKCLSQARCKNVNVSFTFRWNWNTILQHGIVCQLLINTISHESMPISHESMPTSHESYFLQLFNCRIWHIPFRYTRVSDMKMVFELFEVVLLSTLIPLVDVPSLLTLWRLFTVDREMDVADDTPEVTVAMVTPLFRLPPESRKQITRILKFMWSWNHRFFMEKVLK